MLTDAERESLAALANAHRGRAIIADLRLDFDDRDMHNAKAEKYEAVLALDQKATP